MPERLKHEITAISVVVGRRPLQEHTCHPNLEDELRVLHQEGELGVRASPLESHGPEFLS